MNSRVRWVIAALFVASTPMWAQAQGPRAWDGGGPNDNWTTATNWAGDLFPTGFFQEYATISNGDTVLVNSDLNNEGYPGAVIVSGGSGLHVVAGGVFNTDTSSGGVGVDGSAQFSGGAKLSITGPSASFTSQSMSFANGGIYNPDFTGASQAAVNVIGTLTAGGGTLKPTFSFSPTPQSWVIADAAAINGNFTVDTSGLGLTAGDVFRTSVVAGGSNGQQLLLTYSKALVLTANVDTGGVSIASPSGTPIAITGYSLTSSNAKLKPATWTTLESQVGGGWDVAGTPSSSRLEELAGPKTPTMQDSLTINATPRTLGSPYDAALPFQTTPANSLGFEYVTTTGELVQGVVQYTGLNTVNNLLLTVDPTTGVAKLKNSSTTTINLRGYTIASPGGALKPSNGDWNSLDDQNVAGVDEANGSAQFLSELVPDPAHPLVLAPGATYTMGDLFDASKAHDLSIQFVMAGSSPDGDFNKDGTVNAADYTVWRDKLGSTYTAADYQVWTTHFGMTGGGSSIITNGVVRYEAVTPGSGAIAAAAVPEPGTGWLVLGCVLGLAGYSRR
ncbi:MAG: hypothetical protein AB7G28_08370 [Pirellulales bacterium]